MPVCKLFRLRHEAVVRLAAILILLTAAATGQQPPSPATAPPPAPNPNAALNHAIELYDRRDFASALPLFRQVAEAGNLDAMRYLGVMFGSGQGVAPDYDEALR